MCDPRDSLVRYPFWYPAWSSIYRRLVDCLLDCSGHLGLGEATVAAVHDDSNDAVYGDYSGRCSASASGPFEYQ